MVVVIALDGPVRFPSPFLQRLLRLVGRDQPFAPADQILSPRLEDCLAHGKPVFRFEKLHQRPLHLFVPKPLGNIYLLLRERIDPSVVPARGDVLGYMHKDQYIGR